MANTKAKQTVVIGKGANVAEHAHGAVAIGDGASVTSAAGDSVALGKGSKAETKKTALYGAEVNTNVNSLKISWENAGTSKKYGRAV